MLVSCFVLQLVDHQPVDVGELIVGHARCFEHVDDVLRDSVVVSRVGLNSDIAGEKSELRVVGILVVGSDDVVHMQLAPLER